MSSGQNPMPSYDRMVWVGTLDTHTHTKPPSSSPSKVPASSNRMEFDAKEIGFTLKADEQTLRKIDQVHEATLKAAQAVKKFVWR